MKHPNPSRALADVLVDELVRLGVTDLCLAPGSRSAAMAMAAHDAPGLRVHVGVDERSVAFLALGLARAARRPAAVLSTSGTAAASFLPAVVEASEARVPLLVLTADRPPEMRHTAANQTIDQVKLYGGAVRWFAELGPAADRPDANAHWRSTACRAWAEATGARGPAGAVHLNLAFREPLVPEEIDRRGATEGPFTSPTDGRNGGRPWTSVEAGPRLPADDRLARLAAQVAATERGLVVAGDGVDDPAPVVAFAEAAGWPLLAEPLSGARSGRNAISTYHHLLGAEAFAAAHRPELVVRFGRVGLSRPLLSLLSPDLAQVLVDADAAWLDPTRVLETIVAADPSATASALCERLPGHGTSPWLGAWQDAERGARAVIDDLLDGLPSTSEPRVARDVARAVPDGGTLMVGSSMPVRDVDAYAPPRDGLRVLGNRGASGIDGSVSTAIGIALGSPGPTVALLGDLALLHDGNGFLLLDEEVDLPIVVVNNDGGGIFSFLPQADFPASFERLFGTPHGRDLGQLATFHRLDHEVVDRPDHVRPAVEAALADGGIRLLEVRTDRTENVALHRRIQEAVATAVAAS